ncbi:DUF1214 domain-containing protein [Variovorax paradoxus]|nr:DUF1214 domain-containing protein [Variovorax paradoxus]
MRWVNAQETVLLNQFAIRAVSHIGLRRDGEGGFWSITMYLVDGGCWFVPNPLNRFTVSPRDNPKFNSDGSLTVYFQKRVAGQGQGKQLAADAEG